jgi:hypothetical protein
MRMTVAVGVLALFALAQPASAQMMCGGAQQPQASSATGGGMMCGGMNMSQPAPDPMADPSAQKPQQSGMCPCCRNMAMMRGGSMQHQNMPGMDMPKQ